MRLEAGTQLGPYTVIAPLGKGGMGEVYRAKDERLGREVAIKVLPEHLADNPQILKRFKREAKTLAEISHPNILTVYDVGVKQDTSYVVTELLQGETLRERIQQSPMEWKTAVGIGLSVVEGLAAAHSRGIIHRDLKPENVFLTRDGRVKILDFGLARHQEKATDEKLSEAATFSTFRTETGAVIGTLAYMSPEQVRGMPLDARSDIFAFGCMLYEMVCGSRPFSGTSGAELAAAILKDSPKILHSRSEIPHQLDRIISRCLEKDPDHRFQSAADLAFHLKALTDAKGSVLQPPPKRMRRTVLAAGLSLLLILIGISSYLFLRPREEIRSLAVIPFVNVGSNPDTEYLSDGIAESLMNSFAQLPNLKVPSRAAVFRYKGKEFDPQQAGRDLRVQAILTGRVEQRGKNLLISVELVDVSENRHLWGDQYNRNVLDILALQNEISRKISEQLRFRLTGHQQTLLEKRYTENNEAYQLYLQGRFYWNKRTTEGARKGIEFFRKAIEKDPNYALAYSGLADCYRILEDLPAGREAGEKALQLDDTLPEAHSSLGRLKMNFEWDFAGAEAEYKRAIQFNPNYTEVHHVYSHLLLAFGKVEESFAESKLALDLMPHDVAMNAHLAWHYLYSRQYDQALSACQRTIEMDPSFYPAQFYLGQIFVRKGLLSEAIQQFQKAIPLTESSTDSQSELAYSYARSGNKELAQKILNESLQLSAYEKAIVYLGLRQKDRALTELKNSYRLRSQEMLYVKVEPLFDELRSSPQFQQIVAGMKFPE